MKIILKDGSFKEYENSKSVIEIAADISEGLARVATAGEIDGEVVDLRTVVDKDCELNILTFNDEKGKGAFRHTASHIMAQAVKRLYPETKLAIGPSVADGFYYDVDRETPFTADDLEKITQPSVEIYKSVATISEEEIKSMMDEETWITAEEALSYGFATEIQKVEAQQKAEDKMMYSLVMKCKQLEKKLQESSCEEQDAWKSYFKGKRS